MTIPTFAFLLANIANVLTLFLYLRQQRELNGLRQQVRQMKRRRWHNHKGGR